jgi:phosphoglycolate phosphatase
MPESAQDRERPRLLVLWDIDHTLIETRGVGGAIFKRAFLAATGVPLSKRADISGRTELDIMRESLAVNGIEPTEERIQLLADTLVRGYDEAREELGNVGRVLPGASETLAELAADPAISQTVLTGNLREVARIKLEVFGLDGFLDLKAGAYGDDASERAELVAVAQTRAAERFGVSFDNDQTLLIGDTPNDVRAGLTAGVRVLGVGTGKTAAESLRDTGAWAIASSLEGVASEIRRLTI